VEPFLVSSSVSAILAQRLVRRVCERCKSPYVPAPAEVARLGLEPGAYTFFHGTGCAECTQTGYRGRLGLFEILLMDEALRALILTHADASSVREYADTRGLKTLRQDGAAKILAGVTTTEEVLRVVQQDEAA